MAANVTVNMRKAMHFVCAVAMKKCWLVCFELL